MKQFTIPDDYFENEPAPERDRLPVPTLEEIRIVPRTMSISNVPCRSSFSRTFQTVGLTSGQRFDINCRSHRCEKHRDKWASRWGAIISEQLQTKPVSLLVNLTTPQWVTHKEVARALEVFIKMFRAIYGKTEYLKVVEENKKHTQPHFHFLFICTEISVKPMPQWFIDKQKKLNKKLSWPEDMFQDVKQMWTEALSYAKPNVYFRTKDKTGIVWLQPCIGKGERAAQYALGYITGQNQRAKEKGEDVSDKWRGRKITFSKGFFDLKTGDIWAGLLKKWFGDKDPEFFGLVFNAGVPKDLRLEWLDKKSSTKVKTRLDFDTGEIITEILDTIDVRYRLHLGLNFEASKIITPYDNPPLPDKFGYDYLVTDKLFEIDIGTG